MSRDTHIVHLTPELEDRIRRIYSLNIDSFIIPSPFIRDGDLEKDYDHSYVWQEEGEILGYLLVFSNPGRTRFHLYKQVTSPFGRGKGIGSAFIHRLAEEVSPDATLYLIIWEKHQEAMLFFEKKGFTTEDRVIHRGLAFHYMEVRAGNVQGGGEEEPPGGRTRVEDLGKTRHDARKALRLLSEMVDRLGPDNCNRIIEDINRETTALINMLNAYRDSLEYSHEVNIKSLIIERILPFIEMSPAHCEVRFVMKGRVPEAYGHYLDIGRALVNLVSNALDAIREAGRPGRISITLEEKESSILLTFRDNGVGIDPGRLKKGEDGIPLFVGRTTKTGGAAPGQGIGTRQIFAVFGADAIDVKSSPGRGTVWSIRLARRPPGDLLALQGLETRYREYRDLMDPVLPAPPVDRVRMATFIWHLRKLEILSWDLILQFAKYHNVREIYRSVLAHRFGRKDREALAAEISRLKVDHPVIRGWLLDVLTTLRRDEEFVLQNANFRDFGGVMLKSYGQAGDRTVVFTLDPESGMFFATDRKLAEHVDFAPYLGRERDELLRGEHSGDVNDPARPITLGVWSIRNGMDAEEKIALVRRGACKLAELGLKADKKIAFYQTTYVSSPLDINSYITTTLGELCGLPEDRLRKFLADTDEDIPAFVVTD